MNPRAKNNYLVPLQNAMTREGWQSQHGYQDGEPEIRVGPWTVFVDSVRPHEDRDAPPSGIWYIVTGEDASLAFFSDDRYQVVEWLRPYSKLFVAQ